MRISQPVLDKGYVKFVDGWGNDESIIEAARMSTDKGFLGWGTPDKPGDEKLLAFLWKNKHHTPFEMAGLTIEVKAPIFVFREWHRHRVPFSYNEMSARYVPLPDENYMPDEINVIERSCTAATTANRQASSMGGVITPEETIQWLRQLDTLYNLAQEVYEQGMELGVPKELARLVVPVGRYSRMRASANLRGWLAFLTLRDAPNAQWEIQQYAKAVARMIEDLFPRTYAVYKE